MAARRAPYIVVGKNFAAGTNIELAVLKNMRTPKNVYSKFLEFEERAAGIYLEFVSRFSKDPELSSFWLDMSMHEKQHAGLLQFCLRDGLFARNLPDSTEIQKLNALFKRLEKQATDPKLTAEQAFRIAIELEASEINMIYCYLTETLHDSIYLLKRKIAITLPNHVDELLAAARQFGVSDQALQELARAREQCSGQWQPDGLGESKGALQPPDRE